MWNVELTRKASVSVEDGAVPTPSLYLVEVAELPGCCYTECSKGLRKAARISSPILQTRKLKSGLAVYLPEVTWLKSAQVQPQLPSCPSKDNGD